MRQCRSEGAPDADDAGPIVFRASGEALTVVDTVERQRQRVYTSRAVDPTPAPTDQFVHPVDTAVTLTTATIRFPRRLNPLIITDSGAREGVDRNSTLTLEDDDHLLEFEHLFKLYVSFSGRAFLDVSGDEARIDFPGEVEVSIGARSPPRASSRDHHDDLRPRGYDGGGRGDELGAQDDLRRTIVPDPPRAPAPDRTRRPTGHP